MVGDVVKWLCDLCGYMGPSSQSVKSHWTKKHRRGVEEEEAKKRGELLEPENEEKRPREDDESEDEYSDEDLYEGFDEDGNRIEAVVSEEKVDDSDAEMETGNKLPTTEETVTMLKQELETKKAEVESLNEAMAVRMDMLTLANGKVASLEIEKEEQEKKIKRGEKVIKSLRDDVRKMTKTDAKAPNKGETKAEESKLKKELKEANTKLESAMKKIREETNLRASLETQLKMQNDVNARMSEIMLMRDRTSGQEEGRRSPGRSPGRSSPGRPDARREILCRNHSEAGGCRRKNCAFFHPSGRSRASPQPTGESKRGNCKCVNY